MSKTFLVAVLVAALYLLLDRDAKIDSAHIPPPVIVQNTAASDATGRAIDAPTVIADEMKVWIEGAELDRQMFNLLKAEVAKGARPGEGAIAFTKRVSGSLPGLHLGLRSLNLKETIALAHEYGASVTIYLDGSDSSPTIEAPTLAVGTEPGWRLELVDSEIRVDGSVSKPPSFALGHWKKFPR